MFARFLEGLLPGLRELRTPLVAGVLWVVAGWSFLSSRSIGTPEHVDKFVDIVGSWPFGAAVSVALTGCYMVGVLFAGPVAWAANAVNRVADPILQGATYRSLIRTKRLELRSKRDALISRGTEMAEADQKTLAQVNEELNAIRTAWYSFLPRRTAGRRSVVPPRSTRVDTGRGHLNEVWMHLETASGAETTELYTLRSAIDREAMDVLYAVDPVFYQIVDRELAERSFRLQTALPLSAVAASLVPWTTWWLTVVAAGLVLFGSSAADVDPRTRVVNYLTTRQLTRPSRTVDQV